MEKDEILFIRDLPCFLKDPENAVKCKLYSHQAGFTIGKMPTQGLRDEWRAFILSRAEKCTLYTICGEKSDFNNLCLFFSRYYPKLDHITEVPLDDLMKNLKKWMMKNQIGILYMRRKKSYKGQRDQKNPILRYLKQMYAFHNEKDIPETEKDVWDISRLDFKVNMNPVHRSKTISFERIEPQNMKQEAKAVIKIAMRMYSFIYVQRIIAAATKLSNYLSEKSNINSFTQVTRKTIEDFLVYYNTEMPERKNNHDQIYGMKAFYYILSELTEKPELQRLFMNGDASKRVKSIYKVYSDRETKLLNAAFKQLEPQYYRAILLHQLLGTRISETLALRQNCINKDQHGMYISLFQAKTKKWLRKPASKTVVRLVNEAIEYTNTRYENCEYVFASPSDPAWPMSYGTLRDRIKKVIFDNDLRDDNGQLFGVSTHFFRHAFGKRLTEQHIDDLTISKLLGHSGTSSVKYYRQISNRKLAEETKTVRKQMNDMIGEIIKEWDDYDEI